MIQKQYKGELEEPAFCLTMQMLYDVLDERYQVLNFYPGEDIPRLRKVSFFREQSKLSCSCVYIVKAEEIGKDFRNLKGMSFLVIGEIDISLFSESSSVLQVSSHFHPVEIFELFTETFNRFFEWDYALQKAMYSENPLDTMLKVSLAVFKNPIYIHDVDFFILSCPMRIYGLTVWEIEARTGREMVPLSVINDLKIDLEYIHTLKQHEVDMFSENQRGYRILYVNLWNENRYEGRICVSELQSIITDGFYWVLEYLSRMVVLCSKRRSLFWYGFGKEIEQTFVSILEGKINDQNEIFSLLRFLGWRPDDAYLCIKIGTDQQDFDALSPVATFGYIESQVNSSHAFLYQKSIVVIINLSAGKSNVNEVVSNLAYLLREGLFKIGVSNELYDFLKIIESYKQASIALECGFLSESMHWCFHYEDYILDYIVKKICEELPAEFICTRQLIAIKKYDQDHNTNFYETLEIYLRLERNVVKTARELFVHRSTLFYRLERIQKLTNLNLDDPNIRLYLSISFYLMEKFKDALEG